MEITLQELCDIFGVSYSGNGELKLTHTCGLDGLHPQGITYVEHKKGIVRVPLKQGMLISHFPDSTEEASPDLSAVIVQHGVSGLSPNLVYSNDPIALHVAITNYLHPPAQNSGQIHPKAILGKNVKYGKNVTIDANATIYEDVQIGDNTVVHSGVVIMGPSSIGKDCILYPNATIRENCTIGNRVIIQSGCVIGSDGYGFFERNGAQTKIPQNGGVIIEDDVELGASNTVDCGRFENTVIRKGCKFDNLVHIGHNAEIGEHSLITTQSCVGGSVKTGHHLKMAGQTGIVAHVEIGNNVSVAARAGITERVRDNTIIGGMPGRPLEEWRNTQAALGRLGSLFERIRELEKEVEELKKQP